MLTSNTPVTILPAYRDPGDEAYSWITTADEDGGRVTISPIDHPFTIKPVYVVRVEWLAIA